jgi:hypothetical protein
MGDMGAGLGMLVVETIAKIRRAFFVQKKPIKVMPRVSGVAEGRAQLDGLLLANQGKPARERLTLIRIFEELRGLGYEGSYDAVRRYAKRWRTERGAVTAEAYVPLSFAPGEAYQFDWSHEVVLINGTTSAQARRQLWLMAGYFLPQGPSSKAVSAVSPASASTGR